MRNGPVLEGEARCPDCGKWVLARFDAGNTYTKCEEHGIYKTTKMKNFPKKTITEEEK